MKHIFSLLLILFSITMTDYVLAEEDYIKVEPLSVSKADYPGKEILTAGTFMRMVEDGYWKGRFYIAETKTAFYYDGGNAYFQLKKLEKGDQVQIIGKVLKYTDSDSYYIKVIKIVPAQPSITLYIRYSAKFREMKGRKATADEYYQLANEIGKKNRSVWGGIISERLDSLKTLIYKTVLKSDPGHEGARKALGYKRYKDKWMTSKEIREAKEAKYATSMRAKGLIEFEGEWITPDEKMAIQKERDRQREERERYEAEQRAKGLVKYKSKWMTPEQKEKKEQEVGPDRKSTIIYYLSNHEYVYKTIGMDYRGLSNIYAESEYENSFNEYDSPKFIGWDVVTDPNNPKAVLATAKFKTTGAAEMPNASYSMKKKMKEAVPLLSITWRINDSMGLKITPYNFYAKEAISEYKDLINRMWKSVE